MIDSGPVRADVVTALRAVPDATAGEILPNWASYKLAVGAVSMADLVADQNIPTNQSSYNPANNSGSYGDRLLAAPAFPRITKLVKGPTDPGFSSTPPAVTGGQTVQYQLSPTLTSAVPSAGITEDVWVEDCLPSSQSYISATVTPNVVSVGSVPGDAKISCPNASDTYIRWDLGQRQINATIPPIVVDVRVSSIAADGAYTNTTTVWSENDASALALRTSTAGIQIVNPAGIKIEKVALTPVTQVNRTGQTTNQLNKWSLTLANVNGPTSLTNPDVIDVLPKQGAAGTAYQGTFAFVSAAVTTGTATLALHQFGHGQLRSG